MTDAAFADAYCEEAGPQAPWGAASAAIHEHLRPLLESLGVDACAIVAKTVDATRALAHCRLRTTTQLGRADGAGKRLAITIFDNEPPPIQPVLEQLPSELLWALIHRRTLALTRAGVEHLLSGHDPLVAAFEGALPPSRATLEGTTDFITRLTTLALDRTDRVITTIKGAPADVLGAHYFRDARIELPLGPALARAHRVDADGDHRFVVRLDPATRIQRSPCDTLPNRRRRVAELVSDGLSDSAIAKELGITIATVKTHLRKIFATLGVQSRVELALRKGRGR